MLRLVLRHDSEAKTPVLLCELRHAREKPVVGDHLLHDPWIRGFLYTLANISYSGATILIRLIGHSESGGCDSR